MSTIHSECTKPMLNLITDVGNLIHKFIKDMNPVDISAESAHNIFEKNLIFIKSFGVLLFIIIALYRVSTFDTNADITMTQKFFIESVMYGLSIALPFYILLKLRKNSFSHTKIVCFSTAIGVFFFMLNYVLDASGFMGFSFKDVDTIVSNEYKITSEDTRLLMSDLVTKLTLPDVNVVKKWIIINTQDSDLTLMSNNGVTTISHINDYTSRNNTLVVPKNTSIKLFHNEGRWIVQDYSMLSLLFPSAPLGATYFEQFLNSFSFASKFIIGALMIVPFIVIAVTIPLSQRNLNMKYVYNFSRIKSILFFLFVETFLVFGILGSFPMLYMAYNRSPDITMSTFLHDYEDKEEFLKMFFVNVAVMSIANIVFQTSGFYQNFLGQ